MFLYLAITLSAIVFLGASSMLTSYVGFLIRGEGEECYKGSPEGMWLMLVMLALNAVCVPILFSLWRKRHVVREIDPARLRPFSLLLRGIPINKRIWFLVLLVSWATGFVLGMIPPY